MQKEQKNLIYKFWETLFSDQQKTHVLQGLRAVHGSKMASKT